MPKSIGPKIKQELEEGPRSSLYHLVIIIRNLHSYLTLGDDDVYDVTEGDEDDEEEPQEEELEDQADEESHFFSGTHFHVGIHLELVCFISEINAKIG